MGIQNAYTVNDGYSVASLFFFVFLRSLSCFGGVVIHDKLAPTKLLALQTPSFVRIRWVDLVSGSTHAASRSLRVMKPCHPEF